MATGEKCFHKGKKGRVKKYWSYKCNKKQLLLSYLFTGAVNRVPVNIWINNGNVHVKHRASRKGDIPDSLSSIMKVKKQLR